METNDLGKTSIGLPPKVAALLCYLIGFVSGIIFFIIEKENKFVRFHALQSTIVFGTIFVIGYITMFIPFLQPILGPILPLVYIILWILLMIKAYQGESFKIPIAGDIAEKNS